MGNSIAEVPGAVVLDASVVLLPGGPEFGIDHRTSVLRLAPMRDREGRKA